MGTLTLEFHGVNAYVPGANQLEVYMPNGTRLGESAQGTAQHSYLSPHRPTLWQFDRTKRGRLVNTQNLRYFPWSELVLDFVDTMGTTHDPLDLSDVNAAGGPDPLDRFPLDSGRIGNVLFTAGKVVLPRGRCSVMGGCTIDSWSSPHPQSSVVKGLTVVLRNLDEVRISFRSLIHAGAPVPLDFTIPAPNPDIVLAIGNVCSDYILRWERNDELHFPDRDFAWLYQMTTAVQEPLPVVEQLNSNVDAFETPEQVLRDIDTGGGGGIGCECFGIVARL